MARINNLFDEKYEEYVGYWNNISQYTPATGRNYSVEKIILSKILIKIMALKIVMFSIF